MYIFSTQSQSVTCWFGILDTATVPSDITVQVLSCPASLSLPQTTQSQTWAALPKFMTIRIQFLSSSSGLHSRYTRVLGVAGLTKGKGWLCYLVTFFGTDHCFWCVSHGTFMVFFCAPQAVASRGSIRQEVSPLVSLFYTLLYFIYYTRV